jgi:hypothetical protein
MSSSAFLVQAAVFVATGVLSTICAQVLLYARGDYVAAEASVPRFLGAAAPPPAEGALALNLYGSSGGASALATAPPDGRFARVRQEGWCFAAPPPTSAGFRPWPLTNLSLWALPPMPGADFRTCGTAACEAAAAAKGYVRAGGGAMCLAFDASTVATLPCSVPLPSIARADAAFFDQNYWRGRAWAPQSLLVYLGLERYDHVPALRAARGDLVAMGEGVLLREWALFGHVAENYNAVTGFTQDSGDADPMYAWGGCFGLMGVLEALGGAAAAAARRRGA